DANSVRERAFPADVGCSYESGGRARERARAQRTRVASEGDGNPHLRSLAIGPRTMDTAPHRELASPAHGRSGSEDVPLAVELGGGPRLPSRPAHACDESGAWRRRRASARAPGD